MSVAGQEIFPVFNNLATLAPQKCEVDTCNQVRQYFFIDDVLMSCQKQYNRIHNSPLPTIFFYYFTN